MKSNVYYVYQYVDPKTNTVVYIGKGKDDRAYKHLKLSDNKRLHNMIQKRIREGFVLEPKIISNELSEQDAFLLEKR